MPDPRAGHPLYLSIAALRASYAKGELSPETVLHESLERLSAFNPRLHAFLCTLEHGATAQARAAARAYREGTAGPLAGIPLSIKDTFDIGGAVSTRGSLVYRDYVAQADSGAVRRLRAAGAVFVGKTNTAEFGQSATTDNRLGEDARNPWNLNCTPGGSTGGGAASVAAGIVTAALGADGGGSLRIPAAFTGIIGFKPTFGLCFDEGGFPAMSEFCCPGPLVWRIADARTIVSILAQRAYVRATPKQSLRVAWCVRPQGSPVDLALAAVTSAAVRKLADLGHYVEEAELPIDGWNDIFGPLVLEEEGRLRGHLLASHRDQLSDYERTSLEAATNLKSEDIATARNRLGPFRQRIDDFFAEWDLIVTPTTAVPSFRIGERPQHIAGEPVDTLWGAFPFTAPFNVAGTPAASIPCGLAGGLPIGLQLICARGRDGALLDIAEDLDEALAFDAAPVIASFREQREPETVP